MRVTNEMIANQVVYNLSRNINKFYVLQNQMSTSRRINKASDDPIGTVKDLSYRDRLNDLAQYKSNITIGQTWLSTSDSALNDINTAISNAHSAAVEMSNDTFDASAREASANEVQSLLDQILAAGNSQLQGNYIFSGYKTRTQPFASTSVGVVYRGDSGAINYTIDSKAKVQINTIGSDLLTKPFAVIGGTADIHPGILATTLLTNLNHGGGVDLSPGTFTVKDLNLNNTVTVDISAATTINDAITAINAQLTAGGITNVTASLGAEGNNLRLVATDNPTINATTPLASLNHGSGVDMQPGKFEIRNQSGSIDVTIDVTGDVTVGDAIASINAQLAAAGVSNVTAALNVAGTGIDITDTNAIPLGLYTAETSVYDFTAANLGLTGAINPVLSGQNLNPEPSFEVAESAPGETTAANIGLLGKFSSSLVGQSLSPQLLPTVTLAQLNNNNGIPQGGIRIAQGDTAVTINTSTGLTTVQDLLDAINSSGLAITASINAEQTGIQITNNDPTKTLIVSNADDARSASTLGVFGSTDVLGSMMLLVQSLHNNDRGAISELVGTLDSALNTVLNQRASTGAKVIRMETTLSRLEDYDLNYTKLLSQVEDADVTKLITDLAMAQNAYQSALNAAARIIQPSLLDFLR
jgi:flagellin-like hook-associated protein FlgL